MTQPLRAEPSLMNERMERSLTGSRENGNCSLLLARFHSSTPEESVAYSKKRQVSWLMHHPSAHLPMFSHSGFCTVVALTVAGTASAYTEFPIKPFLVPFFHLHTIYCVLYNYQSNI